MIYAYCPNCKKETGHARRLGIGTLLAALVTSGLWLLLIPLYPKRCIICGREYTGRLTAPPPEEPQGEKKPCPRCGEDIPLSARVCRFCGHEFSEADNAEAMKAAGRRQCPHCGSWEVITAYLPDGGLGPWCPRCRRPAA